MSAFGITPTLPFLPSISPYVTCEWPLIQVQNKYIDRLVSFIFLDTSISPSSGKVPSFQDPVLGLHLHLDNISESTNVKKCCLYSIKHKCTSHLDSRGLSKNKYIDRLVSFIFWDISISLSECRVQEKFPQPFQDPILILVDWVWPPVSLVFIIG